MQNIRIAGREFIAQGPLPVGGYVLTGQRGAEYIAVKAFTDSESIYKVIGGRYFNHELWINGQQAYFEVKADGSLAEWVY